MFRKLCPTLALLMSYLSTGWPKKGRPKWWCHFLIAHIFKMSERNCLLSVNRNLVKYLFYLLIYFCSQCWKVAVKRNHIFWPTCIYLLWSDSSHWLIDCCYRRVHKTADRCQAAPPCAAADADLQATDVAECIGGRTSPTIVWSRSQRTLRWRQTLCTHHGKFHHKSCLDSPPHPLVNPSLSSSPLSSSITPSLFHPRLIT